MSIYTFVKGVNNFGKEQVVGSLYKYNLHYPRPVKNDIMIYFYPNDRQLGIYQVQEETDYYFKDGFQFCEGKMVRLIQDNETPEYYLNRLAENNKEHTKKLSNIIDDLVAKYLK